MRRSERVIVLSNVVRVRANPWVGLWISASRRAGVDVLPLHGRALLVHRSTMPAGVHLQWPEQILSGGSTPAATVALVRLLALVALARLRRLPVLLTMHNVTSHDGLHLRLERLLWWVLPTLVTHVHVLSEEGRTQIVQRHPRLARRRWFEVPHGDYRSVLGPTIARRDARRALDIDPRARLYLTFGSLKAYKGTDALVESFRGGGAANDVLVVAGRTASDSEAQRLGALCLTDPRVRLHHAKVTDGELARYLAACDLVVLPYRAVLNSGSALLALSATRPVLVPSTPTFEDLSRRTGEGWVVTYPGPLTTEVLSQSTLVSRPAAAPSLEWCSWPRITDMIEQMWSDITTPSATG